MSFILDAIKKSEDERQRSKGPDVYSLQNGAGRHREPAPAWLRILLLLLSIAIISWIALWLWPQMNKQFGLAGGQATQNSDTGAVPQRETNMAAQPMATGPAASSDTPPGGPGKPGVTSKVTPANTAAPSQAYPAADATASGSGERSYASDDSLPPRHLIKELWELPADYQSTVPDLKFSFHVYSPNPDKRTIIINGRRVREGQMVTSQMRLRVITDTGVICHYRGRFFHVDVVEKW
ncbi:MAG: general secretion pathway protein GspB [Gammaproteobacteria bacterium]|nr:general secretion pathway protein GspB [Gammaproteobacteria bacterium]NNM10674.1 general secretion pathway protein GspB [Pseudomonadales bacterium]